LLYGRLPTEQEAKVGSAFLAQVTGPGAAADAAWDEYCQILLCANEFIYVD
jgi:hypothetical protein